MASVAQMEVGDMAASHEPYRDGLELVADALERLDRRLAAMLDHLQGSGRVEDANLPGLVITEAEVRRLLASGSGESRLGAAAGPAGLWVSLAGRVEATRNTETPLALDVLRERFGLSDFEVDCLLVCLAPEVDERYEKLFAYLNDDLTRKYPSVGLLLRLVWPGDRPPVYYRRHLTPQAPLLRCGLLAWADDGRGPVSVPHLARGLRVAEGVVRFLLGEPPPDPALVEVWDQPARPSAAADLWCPEEGPDGGDALLALLEHYTAAADGRRGMERLACRVSGRPGSGRRYRVEAACAAFGLGILAIDSRGLLALEEPESVVRCLFRDSVLHAAPVLLTQADALAADRERGPRLRALLEREMDDKGWLIFLAVEKSGALDGWFARCSRVEVAMAESTSRARGDQWRRLLAGTLELPPDEAEPLAEALAAKFRLTPGGIAEAFQSGVTTAAAGAGPADWWTALHLSAARVSAPRLGELAEKLESPYRLGDIVLPAAQLEQLSDVLRHVRYRRKVMEDWRFARRMPRGRGLNVLFSGPPGTGKTMAAEILGNELGMELYRIDLASVVSKYIGETEKNLARIFREAEHSDVVLFFDEADALFGKRSEVRDAHDRYANIEINYLLQRMEAYEGVAILASNLRHNLDPAFLRRIRIVLEFPLPSPEDRLRIWRKTLPEEVRLEADVDFEFLAREIDLTGGSIKNVGLAAAFLAAEEGDAIAMRHLVRATRRELEKLGKRSIKNQFGPYREMLEPPARPAAES